MTNEPTPEPKPLDAERRKFALKEAYDHCEKQVAERLERERAQRDRDAEEMACHECREKDATIAAQAAELALAKQAVLDEGFKGAAAEERANELAAELASVSAAAAELVAALSKIAEGRGRYSMDPHEHACNVIEEAIETAKAALAPTQSQGDETRG